MSTTKRAKKEKQLLTWVGGVPVYWDGEAITFKAGFTVDADGAARTYHPKNIGLDALQNAKTKSGKWVGVVTVNGEPVVHKDGYYISTTAYQRPQFALDDRRRYLDAEKIPFVVVPPQFRRLVPGAMLGCLAMARNTAKPAIQPQTAIVGDIGPTFHVGEGSMFLAGALGLNPDPRKGGTSKHIIEYTIWPGQEVTIGSEAFRLVPLQRS